MKELIFTAQPSRGNIEADSQPWRKSPVRQRKQAAHPLLAFPEYADHPTAPGLYFMDTPGHDIEQLTGFAAAGVNIAVFTTGRGTPTSQQ